MARKPKSDETPLPGIPSEIGDVMEQAFGVPARPTLRRDEAIERVVAFLKERKIAYQRLYISEEPCPRDGLFDARGRRVPFPEGAHYDRSFIVLVDPDDHARWAHPAYWAFVPVDGRGEVALRDTNLPPHNRGVVRLLAVPPPGDR